MIGKKTKKAATRGGSRNGSAAAETRFEILEESSSEGEGDRDSADDDDHFHKYD